MVRTPCTVLTTSTHRIYIIAPSPPFPRFLSLYLPNPLSIWRVAGQRQASQADLVTYPINKLYAPLSLLPLLRSFAGPYGPSSFRKRKKKNGQFKGNGAVLFSCTRRTGLSFHLWIIPAATRYRSLR